MRKYIMKRKTKIKLVIVTETLLFVLLLSCQFNNNIHFVASINFSLTLLLKLGRGGGIEGRIAV